MKFVDKYQKPLFVGLTIISLTILFVISSFPVKAATQNSGLPYHVTDRLIAPLSDFEDNYIAVCERDGIFPIGVNWDSDGIIATWSLNDGANGTTYICVPENDGYYTVSLSEPYTSFDVHNDSITITFYNYAQFIFGTSSSINPEFSGMAHFDETFSVTFLGSYSSVDFISSDFYDSSDNLIFTIGSNSSGGLGHATQPINDPNNIIDDGSGNILQRPNKPTPQPFTPQPFTPPSIDTSTLETLVESLIDVVEYGFSYIGGVISGSFSNLLSNLDSWIDYIVQSFNYGFNNVVKAIQNLATDFYNNMVSLFEPMYDFFASVNSFFTHLIQIGTVDGAFNLANIVSYLFLPDSSAIYPIFVSHDEFNIIGITNHIFNEYRTFMSSVENINTLHYMLIPSFTFHGITVPQTRIDFEWFSDYKVYSDGIISAFLIVGYIYFLFTRIGGWLRGNQGDVYVGDNSSNYHGTKIGF